MVGGRRVSRRTARRTSRRTSRRMDRRQAAYDDMTAPPPQQYEPAPPPPAQPAAPAPSVYEELEKVAKLHESGVLSDEEFAAAKAKILGQG
jgi:hypothetical protein